MNAAATPQIAIVGAGQKEPLFRAMMHRISGAEAGLFVDQLAELFDMATEKFDAVLVADASPDPAQLVSLHKPVFLSSGSAVEVVSMVEAFGGTPEHLLIATPLRFQPEIAAVKESLDFGQLGDPGLLRVHCWRHADEQTHSCLLDEIDLACWFFAARPLSIYAISRDIRSTDDYTQIHFGFPDGGMAVIDLNSSLPRGDSYRSLSLIGSAGAAYADAHDNIQLIYQGDHPSAIRTVGSQTAPLAELKAFVESLRTNRKLLADADFWKGTTKVADAADASKNTGRAFSLVGNRYELT